MGECAKNLLSALCCWLLIGCTSNRALRHILRCREWAVCKHVCLHVYSSLRARRASPLFYAKWRPRVPEVCLDTAQNATKSTKDGLIFSSRLMYKLHKANQASCSYTSIRNNNLSGRRCCELVDYTGYNHTRSLSAPNTATSISTYNGTSKPSSGVFRRVPQLHRLRFVRHFQL